MTTQKMTTSWTWLDNGEIRALNLDVAAGVLRWYDQIGCHCADDDYWPQTVSDFRQNGNPPLIGDLPEDVSAELGETLALIEQG